MPSFIINFMSSFQKLSILLVSTLFIAACGGGSDSGGDGLAGISDDLSFSIITPAPQNTEGVVEVTITLEDNDNLDTGSREVTVQLQAGANGIVGSLSESEQLSKATFVISDGGLKFPIYRGSIEGNGQFVLSVVDDDGDLLVSDATTYSISGVTVVVDPDVETGAPSITVQIVQQDDSTTPLGTVANPITDSIPGFVQATVLVDGAMQVNQLVSFSNNQSLGELSPGTALTNTSGVAEIDITAGAIAGAGSIEVSVTIGEDTVTESVNFQTSGGSGGAGPTPDSLILTAEICKGGSDADLGGCNDAPAIGGAIYGDGNDPLNDADGSGFVTALLTDNLAVPQVGVLLNFTITAGGVLQGDSGITDNNGLVVVRVSPGSTPGAGALTISEEGGVSETINVATLGDSGAVQSIYDLTLSILDAFPGGGAHGGSSAPITSGIPGFVVANISSSGGGIIDELVTFSVNNSNGLLAQDTALSDSSGDASVQLNPGATSGAGTITATVEINGETITETVNFESSVSESTADIISMGVDWGQPGICDDLDNDGIEGDPVYSSLAIYVEDKGNADSALTTSCQVSGANTFNANAVIRELKTGVTAIIKVQTYNETTSTLFSDPIEVVFSSLCAELDKAALGSAAATTSTVTSVGGTATTTYLADGCVGEDTITATASVGGETLAAQVTFDIETPAVSSIQFVSATPQVLALQGTGGANRVETSVIQYRVVGTDGNPSANRNVYLALANAPGGVTLDTNLATSNADGIVEVTVNSGTVSGTLRIQAAFDVDGDDLFDVNGQAIIDDDDIVVFSDELSIGSGLADADGINIFVSSLNPEAWSVANESVQVTASLNDRGGENVAIGTAISFRTEFGRIGDAEGDATCFTDITGSCSVTWFSNGVEQTEFLHFDSTPGQGLGRPGGNSAAIDYDRRGRNVIYAFTQGEETFVDADGDNVFDPGLGDAFIDIGEFFFDFNESGSRELGAGPPSSYLEPYQEFNGDSIQNIGDGLYNGVSCTEAAVLAGHCSGLVNVSDELTLNASSSFARIYLANSLADLQYQGFIDANGEPDWRSSGIETITTNTTDATDGFYSAVATTSSGAGTGLSLDIIVENGAITSFNESSVGADYINGDTVTVNMADIGGTTNVVFTYPVIVRPAGNSNSVFFGGDTGTLGVVYVLVADSNGNAMPEGTIVSADSTGGVGVPTDNDSFIIGASTEPILASFPVDIGGEGSVIVSAVTPNGSASPAELFTFRTASVVGDCHTIHFASASLNVGEPANGDPNLTVTMDIEIDAPVFTCTDDILITYFVTGSAVGDHEFTGVSDLSTAAVTDLPAGNFVLKFSENYRATVSFDIAGDALFEGTEEVKVFLGIDPSDSTGARLGDNGIFTLTIPNT